MNYLHRFLSGGMMLIRSAVSALILERCHFVSDSHPIILEEIFGNWKAEGNASFSQTWELRDADGTLHMTRTESDRKNESSAM